jgi:hypothetical protein
MVKARTEAEMEIEASTVSETAKQDAGALGCCVQRKFASASVWTEAMLAALQRGVKGGKWHSWPNSFFASLGLFTMSDAHRLARQSRCGNN